MALFSREWTVAPRVQSTSREMFSVPPLVLALPTRSLVGSFTDGCRAAALDFINRVAVSPDKETLAEWLRGPYRAHVVTLARSRTQRVGAASVVPGALAKLLAQTRLEVSVSLLRARDPEDGVGFGYSALAAGLVYRAQDVRGAQGWVPVAQPRMRLADRVLSLVAADYLCRSQDYETALFTCSACGLTAFDAERAPLGVCHDHAAPDAHAAPLKSDIRELSGPSLVDDEDEPLASAG